MKNDKEKQNINFKTNKQLRYNKKFKMRDLKWAIKKSNNSTPGPDLIHYEFLRHLPEETLQILLDIINDYWKNGTFPESWRVALILPIPKAGKDLLYPENYRPIALTSCICKVVERMVNERLIWYLDKNKILSRQQCGFRSNRGTVDHLVRLETFIRDAFRRKEHVVAVFFDLQKAYDTTWKYGILKDLHKIGLRGNLPTFIANFLSDRTFHVLFSTTISTESFVQEEGVPQGAILSTTLFNLKINDIAKELNPGMECSLYVDDFLICYRSRHMANIQREVQVQINKLETWTFNNGFTISKSKTVAMHFSPPYTSQVLQNLNPVLKLGEHKIEVVKETKFLGLIWDSKLTFIPHIQYLKKKCMKAMSILKVLAHTDWGADQTTLLQLYRALIRSKLDYGCIVYGSACPSYIKQLDPVHNQALRLCLGAFRSTPADSLCVEANEPPLEFRRNKLVLQYGIKLRANTDNPAYGFVFPTDYEYGPRLPRCGRPPFRERFQALLNEANIDVEDIAINKGLYEPPVWDMKPVQCLTHLTKFDKEETLPHLYKAEYNITKNEYYDYCFIYTDGSKCGDKVACAYVTESGTSAIRLPDGASIFSAEAKAVIRALEYVKVSTLKKFIIFTDSLSLVQSIDTQNIKNPLVVSILKQLSDIQS